MARDLRELVGRDMGGPLLRFLCRWGFVDLSDTLAEQEKVAARYLSDVARSLLRSFAAQRERSDREAHRG